MRLGSDRPLRALGMLLFLSTASLAQSEKAIAYLNGALDLMQAHAWRRAAVAWPHLRADALARAGHAETTADTYEAIRFALASLGDHHSSLHLSPTSEKLEISKDQAPAASPFTGRYEPEGRLAASGKKTFAIVVVTKCFPENDRQFIEYESKLQGVIAYLDRSHPAAWVVDLRGNVGGNMWPMLAGIGPLLGESDHLGEFFTTEGHSVWRYREGVAGEVADDGKETRYPAVAVPFKLANMPKVAVLIDGRTGSSGEAIAIAFRGRPKTRFFGAHTQGASTANQVYPLSDGAAMWLTVGVDADRSGKQYVDGLSPDEAIQGADSIVPDAKDPVVQAALRWLH